ncbi:MAG: helix-hairpin-helix domain-containing protein [Pseudomonadota bacterium]|nr:helix-hairpin-helix domain-containing protein [Pseudomonadota bacterium]
MAVKSLSIKMLAAFAATLVVAALVSVPVWAAPQGAAAGVPAPAVAAPKRGGAPNVGKVELLDLNTATKEQLMALPGIDEATAREIVRGRPFAKKDQLKSMKILTDQGYDRIKDRVIAKQPPRKKTPKMK